LLLKALQKGDIRDLSVEQLTPFVPMAYKVLEAAKEGEYLFQLLRLHCDKLVKTLFSHRPAEMPP
jgi:hypothetical protein